MQDSALSRGSYGILIDMPNKSQIFLDGIDRAIVRSLEADGRLTFQEVARTVHLSPSTTAERIRRLCASGVIAGYRAIVGLDVLGYTLEAISDVKVKETVPRKFFEAELEEIPEILEALHTTGEFDYQLRMVTKGTADLERIVDTLRRVGAREVQSRIVLGQASFSPARLLQS